MYVFSEGFSCIQAGLWAWVSIRQDEGDASVPTERSPARAENLVDLCLQHNGSGIW